VEILVDESVFIYVWCGNGVPTMPVTRGGAGVAKPHVKFFSPLEESVGHSLKLLGIV